MPATSEERIAHLVRLLERQFRRDLDRRLEEHGVMFGYWEFLRILWEQDGLSQTELADRSGLTKPTVHTAITKMEAEGLIERRVPEGARSRPLIHLSKRGQALENALVPCAVESNDLAAAGISNTDLKKFRKTLLHMIRNLSAQPMTMQR